MRATWCTYYSIIWWAHVVRMHNKLIVFARITMDTLQIDANSFFFFLHYYSYLRYQWGNDVLHFEIINSVIIAWTRIEWAHTIPDTHMEPISGTQGILFKSIIIGWLLLSDNINQLACWHTRVPTSCIHFICIIIRKTYEVFPFRCAICYSFARAQIAVNTSITNQDHGLHISAKTPLTCIWGSPHMTGQCRWIKRKY